MGARSLFGKMIARGGVSKLVRHLTVEEAWYFLEGQGLVWQRQGDRRVNKECSTKRRSFAW